MRFNKTNCYSLFAAACLMLVNLTPAQAEEAAAGFTLTTTAFLDQGALPLLYTCDGKDISPQFAWTDPPPKTKSYVLILADPDAPSGTWYHWVLYNIPANISELPEGMSKLPGTTLAGKNSWGKSAYNGPCPPKGSVHNYTFTLHALDTTLNLQAGAEAQSVITAMKDHILKTITQTAIYSRWLK